VAWASLEKALSGVLGRLVRESENLGSLNHSGLGQTDTAAGAGFRYHRAKTGVQPLSNVKKGRTDLAPSHLSWRDHGRQYHPRPLTGRSRTQVECRGEKAICIVGIK